MKSPQNVGVLLRTEHRSVSKTIKIQFRDATAGEISPTKCSGLDFYDAVARHKLVLRMRCEAESIRTFQSLGGRLTSLDGIKIERAFLPRLVYGYNMKDVLTFQQKYCSPLSAKYILKTSFL